MWLSNRASPSILLLWLLTIFFFWTTFQIRNLYFAIAKRIFYYSFFSYFEFAFVLFVPCFSAFSSIHMKAANFTVRVRTLNCPQGFNIILLYYFVLDWENVYCMCYFSVQFSCSHCFVDIISWVWWLHMHTYLQKKKIFFYSSILCRVSFSFFFHLLLYIFVSNNLHFKFHRSKHLYAITSKQLFDIDAIIFIMFVRIVFIVNGFWFILCAMIWHEHEHDQTNVQNSMKKS